MSRVNKTIDPIHIQQSEYDADAEAKRVVIVSDMQMELNHEDGDSIYAIRKSVTLQDEVADCSGMSKICLYGEGRIEISPDSEGDDWHMLTSVAGGVHEICARRVKVQGKAVMHG